MFGSRRALIAFAFAQLSACSTDVVQTARLPPEQALECSTPGSGTAPADPALAATGEAMSPLIATGYEAGNGPGLYVTARDAFRVYLNGALVAVSTGARQASFVPLTLLPGQNALSVAVSAKAGAPAALVELDELDRAYVSDASWKVSGASVAGYADTSFDDSAWANATDYGPLGALPGCDPTSFPVGSLAHWIGPPRNAGGTAVLRKTITLAPVGFGSGTVGGNGAAPAIATTWADLAALASDPSAPAVILLPEGTYDFRTAARDQMVCPASCSRDPSKPQYTVLTGAQTCAVAQILKSRSERVLSLGSHKTIVGLGRGAQLRGVSFDFGSSRDDIVRNVAVFDVNRDLISAGDAFTFEKPSQIWLDHVTAKWISDGFTSVAAGTSDVTISWFHFDGGTTYECDGEHTRAATVQDANVTFHHCSFDHVESHSPTVQNALARVHVFDSVLTDNLGYGAGASCGAQVLLEGNAFQSVGTPTERSTCADDTNYGLIDAPVNSNLYGDDVGAHHGGPDSGSEPHDSVFTPPYDYQLEPAPEEWRTVAARAGAGGPWALPLSLD